MSLRKHKPKWNLLNTPSRYFIITGGRGSGKSFEVARFILFLSFKKHELILYTRYTMKSAHLSIIPEFTQKIKLLGLERFFRVTKDEIVNISSGSSIIFSGIKTSSGDQTANLKSIQGLTCWVLEEAEEQRSEAIFDTINFSTRSKINQNRVIQVLNPTSKTHFVYPRFFEKQGVQQGFSGVSGHSTYIHTTYLDNLENLSESFLAEAELLKKTNPHKYNHILLGGWLDKSEGVIFTNWEFGEFNDGLQFGYGMDFGFFDPDTLIKVAIDNDRKIIYAHECFVETGLPPAELALKVKESIQPKSLIIADSSEPRLIFDIKKSGLNIVGIKKPTVKESVKKMLDYKIVITPTSLKIAEELNNYSEKNGEPIDSYNHTIDAIRYYFWHTVSPIIRIKTQGDF